MIDLPGWLLVIPILAFLVFVHELGHFVCAKKFNIKVTEFGFGFPPRLYGFRYGETLYSINLIPIGGFVKMVGEEDEGVNLHVIALRCSGQDTSYDVIDEWRGFEEQSSLHCSVGDKIGDIRKC